MGRVVRPRAVTYSGTFHQRLASGVNSMRTLPTIWVHICSVSRVARHSFRGSAGQESAEENAGTAGCEATCDIATSREFIIVRLGFRSRPAVARACYASHSLARSIYVLRNVIPSGARNPYCLLAANRDVAIPRRLRP